MGATPQSSFAENGPNIAQSAQWAAEGKRLIAGKIAQAKEGWPSGMSVPENAMPFAYQSEAVDITADGTYTLHFGPVSSSFNYPDKPTGFTFYFPSDTTFHIIPTSAPKNVERASGRYVRTDVRVSDLTAPYKQLSAWIY